MDEVLSISKVAVACNSSTLYEAINYGSIPVSYALSSIPIYQPSISDLKVGIRVENQDSAISEIESLLFDSKKYLSYQEKGLALKNYFFEHVGDVCIKRIIDEISNTSHYCSSDS